MTSQAQISDVVDMRLREYPSPPMSEIIHKTRSCAPDEFLYESDFDKRGVLFYLGTLGYRASYQNPDAGRMQVQAFSSSLSAGSPSDVLGRSLVNCHTVNEPFSFFGMHLRGGRRLLPTCYSIRNRNSDNYAMLSWRFEGSNDLVNWQLLDSRYNDSHEEHLRAHLCKKGAVSTWGVDLELYDKISFQGY